jgi:hypothetical protein
MRVGTLTDLQGQPLGKIIEADDGTITGEGTGERLVEQAPGKTFDDWMNTLHHSTYLRLVETE